MNAVPAISVPSCCSLQGGKALLLIDVPGHERVRSTVLDKYITSLRWDGGDVSIGDGVSV